MAALMKSTLTKLHIVSHISSNKRVCIMISKGYFILFCYFTDDFNQNLLYLLNVNKMRRVVTVEIFRERN